MYFRRLGNASPTLPRQAGDATLELKGQYPHARCLSFDSSNPHGQPVDALNGQQIEPDARHVNPYLCAAQRLAARRDGTVKIETVVEPRDDPPVLNRVS